MPSDSDLSRRKHSRSSPSEEEADKSSKRHKHRHHRHHRSKKHAEEIDSPPPPPPPPVITGYDDDVEEGEILEEDKDVELRHVDSDSSNLEVQAGKSGNGFVEKSFSDSKDGKDHTNLENYENGNLGYEFKDDDDERRRERSSRKKTSYTNDDSAEVDSIKLSEHRKSSSDRDKDKRQIMEPSRSYKTYGEEVYNSRRSVSGDGSRERSYSLSRDLTRDVERERNDDYTRYFEEEGDRKKERATDKNLRRDRHREGSKDTDMRWDRINERGRGESRDRDRRREADRDLSRDRVDRDHRREHERERSRDVELERDWRRENDRGSRDWEVDRDRRRDGYKERSRDREFERERIRGKERGRSKEREESDKYRQRDRGRSKDMYYARSSGRDREREQDRDRYGDGDHEWESQKERERRTDRSRDNARDKKNDSEKAQISNSDSLASKEKLSRDEDEPDDFEEKISFKLAEQEEDDLERIKEESRKRRQTILEKYKKKQSQEQDDEECGQGQQPTEAAQFAKVASESPDGRIDAGDAAVADPLFSVGKSPSENGVQASQRVSGAAGLGEGTPKSEGSNGKYCDDIFGETPSGVRKVGKEDGLPVTGGGFHDNWDDPEGYYSYRFGEVLDGRYEVAAGHGKGVFSTVVRAKDLKAGPGDPEEVAIKIIRNNETMNKAGKEEVQILKKLAALDPENKRHCVRFVSSFKYRNHLCLVFESLHMNLREVLKKFGRNIGLKLTAIRAYAKQLFIGLKHLKNCGVLHCDIKPDNMLVNEAKNVLKLCDFGNAMSSGKNEITPYLVSRFYRAPEIILGLSYDHPMDMWSVGCCLYELYTGKVLFPGATNNDMLRLHMELKGPFPKKMLKKGAFVDQHFDQDLNFLATEEDPVTKKTVKRMLTNIKPKDIGSIITGSPGEDPKMLANFKDLLDKIFVLDPEKRMTVQQALSHPFITGK